MSIIETDDLTKRYGDETAVDTLELVVKEGEIYGFIGPNGAGKSTAISLLMNYIRPTAGTATVLGYDAQQEPVEIHQRVGILPERFSLFGTLTGRRHLQYVIDSKDANDDPETLLNRVGLADAIDRKADSYSRGMGQRLALAMAIVGEPDLLILDEPFSGLDPHGARLLRAVVTEENERGATVFFSSHVLGQVDLVCDRIGVIDDGELIAEGTPAELREEAELGRELRIRFERSLDPKISEAIDAISGVSSVRTVDTTLVAVCTNTEAQHDALAVARKFDGSAFDFSVELPSLEAVFVEYTAARR